MRENVCLGMLRLGLFRFVYTEPNEKVVQLIELNNVNLVHIKIFWLAKSEQNMLYDPQIKVLFLI